MASRRLPSVCQRLLATKISNKFSEAVELFEHPIPIPEPTEVLVKNRFVGVNASDINYTAGRYDPNVKPPFPCGLEAVGEVASIGSGCDRVSLGQPVAYMHNGAFSEYLTVPQKYLIPVPECRPEYVSLIISGQTAFISLEKIAEMKKGETVLITAAAGGTGQFAVQLARLAGCHVIGTCSSQKKAEFLKTVGCDRVINYTTEKVSQVLKTEYPNGVDVVYESVGGDMFDTCVRSLALYGRIVVIGFVSGYESALGVPNLRTAALPAVLLKKSASLRGFYLPHYARYFPEYMQRLVSLVDEGAVRCLIDDGKITDGGTFRGLHSINRAVQYLYTKQSIGKVVVELDDNHNSRL